VVFEFSSKFIYIYIFSHELHPQPFHRFLNHKKEVIVLSFTGG
jgi:hypothetical protein